MINEGLTSLYGYEHAGKSEFKGIGIMPDPVAVSVRVTGLIYGGAQTSAEFSFPCHSLD